MCGIAGFISPFGIESEYLYQMGQVIAHRGPDDEGYLYLDKDFKTHITGGPDTPENVWQSKLPYTPDSRLPNLSEHFFLGLGHRRLSILDLSETGHLPMCSSDKKYWISFNGEVYNFIELREELKALGCQFISGSDTEVVLQAYITWGEDCQHKFKGMWAFAIYDSEKKSLFLSRDRFGIKPLYYWSNTKGDFFFGSEIKQFTVCPGWKAIANLARVFDYLQYSITDHTSETLFDGVFQVMPGCSIRFEINSTQEKVIPKPFRWYHFPTTMLEFRTYEMAVESFRKAFQKSMKEHIRSDVPVGSCLSGGLDSSAIVCTYYNSQMGAGSIQKTFTAGSTDTRYDERKWAEAVTKDKKIDTHVVYPDLNELFQKLDILVWHQDEPFQSSSIFMQWKVFELAATHSTKVMLDGQGADEQLAGYSGFFVHRLNGLLKKGKIVGWYKELQNIKTHSRQSIISLLRGSIKLLLPAALRNRISLLAGTSPWINRDAFSGKLRHPFSRFKTSFSGLHQESINQVFGANLQKLLHWEDRNSMAFSIESRVPFLDHELVEMAVNLPDSYKINGGISKRILRDAMQNIIPDDIKNRTDKIGFVSPEEKWFREHTVQGKEILEMACTTLEGLVNQRIILDFENFNSGSSNFDNRFWRVICLAAWVKKFKVEINIPSPTYV